MVLCILKHGFVNYSSLNTNTVVDAIVSPAKTGTIGDGKLFVLPVSKAIGIRPSEEVEGTAPDSHRAQLILKKSPV